MAEVSRKVVVRQRQGLHARPAALFVQRACRFRSEIVVRKGKLEVNGKSIMGILMLAVACGNQIQIKARGEDAESAVVALSSFVSERPKKVTER